MDFNIKHVLDGIKNSIFVSEEVEKVAKGRMEICESCPMNSANSSKEFFKPGKYFSTKRPDVHCTVCACNLHAKVRSLHTKCPTEKWLPVATPDESAKVLVAMSKKEN